MPTHIRLIHRTLLEGRFHVYTSPDVAGLHAADESLAGAQRMAIAMVDFLADRDGVQRPSVEFSEEKALAVA